MAMHKFAVEVTLTEINCGSCGGTYALNERFRAQKEVDGGSWHCPYCQGGWGYSQNNENARLKKELEQERARKLAALEQANNNRLALANAERALKSHTTRVKNGTCPCCNRTFKQLAAHMKNKHPEYGT